MHTPRSAAALLPSALLPLLLLSPASASAADRSACVREGASDLAAAAACGDKGALQYCFGIVPQHLETGDLERCFHDAGCTSAEAAIEAAFILHNCDGDRSVAELRRRAPEIVAVQTAAPPLAARQDPPAPTSSADNGGFTPSIQCSTETTFSTSSCPVQSTGSDSGRPLPCFPTTATTSVCAADNICMKDKKGLDVCMLRNNSLDVGAAIVTSILAACFAIGFATLVVLCCRDKRAERRRRARKEAADIAKTNAANATNPSMAAANSNNSNNAGSAPPPASAPYSPPYDPPKRVPSPSVGNAPGQNPFDEGSRF
ncbi:hypothetical protein GGR52DRAFT_576354 [Hypoxylon sp. FL1284]|nr:hypothetical protein GGR52DRAFT_576354 [Hypoxylon sp. FL1284]